MRDLLVATTNPGKIREILPILLDVTRAGTPVRLLTLADLGRAIDEPEETGLTFAENARLKAAYYARATGLVTVAEDSGLVIDALGGRPGVLSARYPGATYPDKFANLYRELNQHPRPWTARYLCAVSVAEPAADGALFECEGVVGGEIWPEPRGSHGFGYDPIFYFPEYGATFGEVTDERKSLVAHRGRAFRQLRTFLMDPGPRTSDAGLRTSDPGLRTLDPGPD
jgi:XTP/dITP diphosphohydrolase